MISRAKEFWKLLTLARVRRYLAWSLFTGGLLFLVESSFIVVVRVFLQSIDLIPADKVALPAWYPGGILMSTVILVIFGTARAGTLSLKDYFSGVANEAFIAFYLKEIIRVALFYPDESGSQELVQLYSSVTRRVGEVVQQCSQLIIALVSGTLLLAMGFWLAPREMVLSLVGLGILILPMPWMGASSEGQGRRVNDEARHASDVLLASIKNNFFLRIYERLPFEFGRVSGAFDRYQRDVRTYLLTVSLKRSYPMFAGTLIIGIVTLISVKFFKTNGVALLSFFYIFVRFSQTMSEAMGTSSLVKFSGDSIDRLADWNQRLRPFTEGQASERYLAAPIDKGKATTLASRPLELSIEKVSFGYEAGNAIFRDLNVSFRQGDVVVIHGPSGAGKSTLLALLLGMLKPTRGAVTLNGLPTHEIRPELAGILGYVGPEPFLNRASVRDNLLYCHPDPGSLSSEEIQRALSIAQVEEAVRALPRGLEEELNETAQLSSGQKQRLAIARSLLRKPRLLILDEATANLDVRTEHDFFDAIRNRLADQITIIISHRSSVDEVATKILRMDDIGSLVEVPVRNGGRHL